MGVTAKKHKIILDVDTATGLSAADIDDGLAIALALVSPEIELLGCTTCGGNARAHQATTCTLRILEVAGRGDIPVAEGRNSPLFQDASASHEYFDDRGIRYQRFWEKMPPLPDPTIQPSPLKAHEFIIQMVQKYPGEITVVQEGADTNLALALLVEPEIAPLVKEVVQMGGSFRQVNRESVGTIDMPSHIRQFIRLNTRFDPEATEIVIKSGIPFTFVTGNVTTRVFLSQEDVNRIEAVDTPFHKFLAYTSRPWVTFYNEIRKRPRGACMHDPLTLATVIDPSLCRFVHMHCDLQRFRRREDPYLYTNSLPPQVRVAIDVESERFEKFLCDRLSSPVL